MKFVPCSDHVYLMGTTKMMIESRQLDEIYTDVGSAYIKAFAEPVLRSVKIFDFGSHMDDDGLFDFGGDLVVHGLFEPPYDATLFLWDDPDLEPGGTRRRAFALSVCLVRRGEPSSLAQLNTKEVAAAMQRFLTIDDRTMMLVFGGSIGKIQGHREGLFQDAHMIVSFDSGNEWSRYKNPDHNYIHGSGVKLIKAMSDMECSRDQATTNRRFLSYCALLNTRGVSATVHSPKNSIGDSREKQGRLPWLSYSVIDVLKPKGRTSSVCLEGRNSPRAHYRRGHIRRLPSGGMTTVLPCLVGSEKNGVVISSYVAKGSS